MTSTSAATAETSLISAIIDDEISTQLQTVYDQLDMDTVNSCETHRMQMRGSFIAHLTAIHDVLAKSGLFRDWCVAVGLKYDHALYLINKAGKLATVQHTAARKVSPGEGILRVVKKTDMLDDDAIREFYKGILEWLKDLPENERIDNARTLERVGWTLQNVAKQFSQWDE